ncbi:hypothetical protein DFJ58DRAFT_722228 [Suillus subalutaceus]|uniref:uncharacterized protein n=1 Tax=Suillus subalutaceus TaxID=48586 RepID=UPI001B886ECD|nr:uncharacterized protein DFJ58DRAFT_722228 [Suillus subalutaceus]KAG1873057.1 hypothetical protein DFJ58DRAFT_722228 [Suillus subalutaceus]
MKALKPYYNVIVKNAKTYGRFFEPLYFIDGEQQEQEEQTIRAFEEAALFTRMVADHDTERASQDQEFIAVIQQDELGIFLPLDPSASDLDNADTRSIGDPRNFDHPSVGDRPENQLVIGE